MSNTVKTAHWTDALVEHEACAEGVDWANRKLYGFCNQVGCRGQGDWHNVCLIGDEGKPYYSHLCSNHSFAPGDLILSHPERMAEQDAIGPWEFVWVDTDPLDHPELGPLLRGLIESGGGDGR